ncbi:RidA family protein, partial [Streptomyces goshikiensis]
MTVQHFTPEGMLQPVPYHHVAVGTGTKHVHVSGQIGRRADGTPVAPRAQARAGGPPRGPHTPGGVGAGGGVGGA